MSWPAVCASGPYWPHPVIRPKISLGFRRRQTCGPSPNFSITPGRKPSINMSALATRRRTTSVARGSLRFSATDCRPRSTMLSLRKRSSIGVSEAGPTGRSMRMTVAPRSARIMQANGAGPMPAISTMVIPERGPGIFKVLEMRGGMPEGACGKAQTRRYCLLIRLLTIQSDYDWLFCSVSRSRVPESGRGSTPKLRLPI